MSATDMEGFFGTGYNKGRVFADWVCEDIFAEYGNAIYGDYFVGDLLENEVKISVNGGTVDEIKHYHRLTGENNGELIRIWDDESIDPGMAETELQNLLVDKFRWKKRKMTDKTMVEIRVNINDDLTTGVLTKNEYDKRENIRSVAYYTESLGKAADKEAYEYAEGMLEYCQKKAVQLDEMIELEYKECGIYIGQIKSILKPVKLETILFRGKPYLSIYDMIMVFDPHKKKIDFFGYY